MTRLNRQTNGNLRPLTWLRRSHRWLGIASAIFLLLLSITGIAINHGNDWGLDERYVSWEWLLDAYGIPAPAPVASFADRGHRATQLGSQLYFDNREVARNVDALTGMVLPGALAVAATRHGVLLLTADGDVVQAIDLADQLRASIDRVGRADNRPIIESDGRYFIADEDVTEFRAWQDARPTDVVWASASALPEEQQAALQRQYRGRGLTLERVLLDVHSGRVVSVAGKALLDVVAVALIVLSVTGLFLWLRRGKRGNGNNGA